MSPGSSGNTFGFSSISSSSFSFIHLHHSCLLLSCVSAWGLNPLPKWTHTHTHDSRRPYYVHTQIPRAILVYMEHTREMHTRIFSHNKKNGGQNKNVILTKTRRKKALRFRRRRRKKKVFFGCQNNRMNKSRGLTSFRPSS